MLRGREGAYIIKGRVLSPRHTKRAAHLALCPLSPRMHGAAFPPRLHKASALRLCVPPYVCAAVGSVPSLMGNMWQLEISMDRHGSARRMYPSGGTIKAGWDR